MHTFKKYGVTYKKAKLINDVELRLLQRTGAPIHIQACIHAGSRHNTSSGLAHFWEHMLLAGTISYPSKLAIAQALEKVGGSFEATTDADLVRLTISLPNPDHFSFGVSILNEILTKSLYTQKAIENERTVILNEQKERLKDSVYSLQHRLLQLMYTEYDLYFNNLGTEASVSSISQNDIREFAEKHITSDHVTFIVSGDIDFVTAQDTLNTIPLAKKDDFKTPGLPSITTDKTVDVQVQPDSQSTLAIGFRCDTKNPTDLAGLVLIQQLAMGRSNPFITALRYNRGLVYGGKTLLWDFNGTSIFSIVTSCSPKNVTEVYTIMHQVLNNILQTGISDDVCVAVQTKTSSYYRFNLQTSKQWLDAEAAAVRHSIDGGVESNALTILEQVDEMNATTLTKIFNKFFNPQVAYHAVTGQISEEDIQQIYKYSQR